RQTLMNRVVALKRIRPERLSRPEIGQRFLREIQALANLSHPNIITAHHADRFGDSLYLVMEFVDGTDLHRLVRAQGPLTGAQAAAYIRQAALGLQHIHEQGLVHRDIKPSNLMVERSGQVVKILDLGLALLGEPIEVTARPDDAPPLPLPGEIGETAAFSA